MPEQPTKEQMHDALFMSLVFSLQTASIQQMGKLKNPLTDKIERDLAQARSSIDMLDMLQAKTKGNLKDDQAKLLERILSELRLNYVEELNKEQKVAAEKPEEAKSEEEKADQPKAEEVESAKDEIKEDTKKKEPNENKAS